MNHQACWNIYSYGLDELFEMQLDGAPAFQIPMIEPVNAFSRSLFVECSLEHSKRLGWMSHSTGGIHPRSDAEGHVTRVQLDESAQAVLSNSCIPLCLDLESLASPNRVRVRVPCSSGTQSAIEAIAAY